MVIFTINVIFTMIPAWGTEKDQTIDIENTFDDGYNTEVGIGIDSTLITILDPNMDLRAYLVFEDIDINSWENLTNATLTITSAATLPFDADSSVTIYGMAVSLGAFDGDTVLSPSEIQSMPLTAASVNVNTSQFYGGAVLNIDVTAIVQELITKADWAGNETFPGDAQGDDIGFMILGAPDETRYFYDYLGDPNRAASLLIHWGHVPTPPAGGGTFNETNRGFNIWFIDHNENRTALPSAGDVIDWARVNMTTLTEKDSGGAFTLQNDTWVHVSELQGQSIGSFYNDTGPGIGIRHMFSRWAINVSQVTDTQPGEDILFSPTGISTESPDGANGLAWGPAGDWAGVVVFVNADDSQFRFLLRERSGVADSNSDFSQSFTETTQGTIYGEFRITIVDGLGGLFSYGLWSDPGFQNLLFWGDESMNLAINNMRYPQLIASLSSGTSRLNDGDFYTFLDFFLPENKTWIVTYPNGTIFEGDLDDYDDALEVIDSELGPDPTDPDPPSQGWEPEGPFSRFSMRLYFLLIGFLLVFGPLMVWAMKRPTAYVFVIGAFIMLIGFALMYAAGQV